MRWSFAALLVVACAPPPVPPRHATTVPPPKPVVEVDPPPRETATPPPRERNTPRDLMLPNTGRRHTVILERRWSRIEQPIDVAEIDFLSRCVRDFVHTQPDGARRALVEAFTHYVTTCGTDGKVVLERPLGFDSRDRKSRSDLALVGTIAPRGAGVTLRLASCGAETAYDRVTITADGESWTSSRLEVRRDAYGCDLAELPYTRRLAKMLRLALADAGAQIRFDGAGTKIELTAGMREELRTVLDAVDAITVP